MSPRTDKRDACLSFKERQASLRKSRSPKLGLKSAQIRLWCSCRLLTPCGSPPPHTGRTTLSQGGYESDDCCSTLAILLRSFSICALSIWRSLNPCVTSRMGKMVYIRLPLCICPSCVTTLVGQQLCAHSQPVRPRTSPQSSCFCRWCRLWC